MIRIKSKWKFLMLLLAVSISIQYNFVKKNSNHLENTLDSKISANNNKNIIYQQIEMKNNALRFVSAAGSDPNDHLLNNSEISVYNNSNAILNKNLGFQLQLPKESALYSDFPELKFNIYNETIIDQFEFYWKIHNFTTHTRIIEFDPKSNQSQFQVFSTLHFYWDYTAEAVPIKLDFYGIGSNQVNESLVYHFVRDNSAPQVDLYHLKADKNVVPIDSNYLPFVNSPPMLQIHIQDNLFFNSSGSIHLTALNQELVYHVPLICPNFTVHSYFKFNLTIPYWDASPEGENIISMHFTDEAENPTDVFLFRYHKDITSPTLSNSDANEWIPSQVSTKHYRFKYYVPENIDLQESLQVEFSFSEPDISEISAELNYRKKLEEIQFPVTNISDILAFPNEKPLLYENITLTTTQVSDIQWKVEISQTIWQIIKDRQFFINLYVNDLAGNSVNYNLQMYQQNPELSFIDSQIVSTVSLFIGIIGFIGLLAYQIMPQKMPRIAFIHELLDIDYDILDTVLAPLDTNKLNHFEEYITRFPDEIDLDRVGTFELEELLNEPLQMVDFDEIIDLFTDIKLDPFQQEIFIREMLALSPEDRADLLKSLKDLEENSDIDDDAELF